jgi:tetratricopeptide (TPR) repeat protein
MGRAVELGRATSDGLYAVDWALLGLAERCKDKGDVEGAIRWLEEAGEVADPDRLFALSGEVAELASEGSADPQLAAKLYERLRERDPTARGAWEPLVGIYRQQGDVESLERVVRETLDSLDDVNDRNTLRVELAKTLLAVADRAEDAVVVLRDALIDDPGQVDALTTLSDYYESSGQRDELIELLAEQLNTARERGDSGAIKASSLRLGALVEPTEAVPIYRQALETGDDADLLSTLLSALGSEADTAERASLTERLLALREGPEAADLARELAEMYQQLDDDDGKLRALTIGLDRAPEDESIRAKLEEHYRDRGDFAGLVEVLSASAERAEDPEQKLTLLKEAAVLYRDQLGDPQNAIELLRQAVESAPDNAGLHSELAACLSANGDHDGAIAALNEALEGAADDEAKLRLLRGRAAVRAAAEDLAGSVADLELAFAIGAAETAAELEAALDQQRIAAADGDDAETERSATLRCVEVMMSQSEREEASQLLADWTERSPEDVDALHLLRDLDASDERWDGLARTCAQLIELESGEQQVDAAAMLLTACGQLGDAGGARESIERVWEQQPDNVRIRGEVRKLYEQIGAHAELAKLMLEEAADMEDEEQKISYLRWAGEALLSVGDMKAAIPALTQVLEVKPDDASARCLLADANTLMGHYDEATILLDEAIATTRRGSPDLCLYHQRKAYVAQAQGDQPAQLEAMKKAHQCSRKNAVVACELADLAEELEEWDLAAQTLRTVATLDGDCPITPAQSLIRQGRIALRQDDRKRALLCARRAKMADSESEELQAFLQELGEE